LRDVAGVARDDDDFVNDVLTLEVEFFGEGEETRLGVDVEVTLSVRLSPVDGVGDATILALDL
jgi:hypothetical protein